MKYSTLIPLFSIAATCQSFAALSAITTSNLNTAILDNTGTALTAGTAADGDGAVYQVGYFSISTNSFDGTWIPITGAGSSNLSLVTTIGDSGGGPDGFLTQNITFDDTTDSDLPAGGSQLAMRFYNAATLAASTHYNTVTNPAWTMNEFKDNVDPSQALDMDNAAGQIWEDSTNLFQTLIPVPEPSSTALLGLGGVALLLRRRR